jgi:hypothetical protein
MRNLHPDHPRVPTSDKPMGCRGRGTILAKCEFSVRPVGPMKIRCSGEKIRCSASSRESACDIEIARRIYVGTAERAGNFAKSLLFSLLPGN